MGARDARAGMGLSLSDNLLPIDTDVLIDAARDIAAAPSFLRQTAQHAALVISAITRVEMSVGCRNKRELQALDRFRSRFQEIRLDSRISDTAIELLERYRLSHGSLIPDALIAATAPSHQAPLATRNRRDSRFIEHLTLVDYP